jgi:hypothetical protein
MNRVGVAGKRELLRLARLPSKHSVGHALDGIASAYVATPVLEGGSTDRDAGLHLSCHIGAPIIRECLQVASYVFKEHRAETSRS